MNWLILNLISNITESTLEIEWDKNVFSSGMNCTLNVYETQ